MAENNIPSFKIFVIIAVFGASAVHGEDTRSAPAPFRFFLAAGSSVLCAVVPDTPVLPQLRSSVEGGGAFFFGERFSATASLEIFNVDPSIPAGALLYRGYSGLSLKTVFGLAFPAAAEGRAYQASVGASASVARYTSTELDFLTLSAFAAPGISQESGGLVLGVYLPLALEFRGGATAFSAGLTLRVNRARRLAPRGDAL